MCKKSEYLQSQVGESVADTVGERCGGPKMARLCVLMTYMTKFSSISSGSMCHDVLCFGKNNCFKALVEPTQRVHIIPRTCGSTRACAHVQSTNHVSGLSAEHIVLFVWLKLCLRPQTHLKCQPCRLHLQSPLPNTVWIVLLITSLASCFLINQAIVHA